MKTNAFVIAAIAALTLGLFALAFAQETATFQDPAFTNPERPPAAFDHDLHMELYPDDCTICHHYYEDGQLVEDMGSEGIPCSDCHSLSATPDNPMPLMKAYHANCIGCHDSENVGPVMCGECHLK